MNKIHYTSLPVICRHHLNVSFHLTEVKAVDNQRTENILLKSCNTGVRIQMATS